MTIPAGQLIVLDTNILVDLVRNNDRGRTINGRFQLTDHAERPLFSTVTEGEIFGLVRLPKWRWGEAKLQKLEELLANLVRVNAGLPNVVDAYAELYAASYATGNSTGDNDLWIAATAFITKSTLLTTDNDFDHLDPQFIKVIKLQP